MEEVKSPRFRDIPQITLAKYQVNIFWNYIEAWILDNNVDMNPDFQREYVWNQKQKEQYIEWVLRNGDSGRDIYFNHPGWFKKWEGQMVIVDGKQRIDAVIGFMYNKVKAYGFYLNEYVDKFNSLLCNFVIHVADLESREEVLQWYIDMNTGGTVHTEEEIEKVKSLLK